MDKIKTVKIKNPDGSVSEETYTISVDAKDVDMANGKELQETIGTIDVDRDGNIAEQLGKYKDYDSDIETLYADVDTLEAVDTDLENDIINLQVNKINKTDIVDNLNSSSNTKVLSAKQGNELRKIDSLNTKYPLHSGEEEATVSALSNVPNVIIPTLSKNINTVLNYGEFDNVIESIISHTNYNDITYQGYQFPIENITLSSIDYNYQLPDNYIKEGMWILLCTSEPTKSNWAYLGKITNATDSTINVTAWYNITTKEQELPAGVTYAWLNPVTKIYGQNFSLHDEGNLLKGIIGSQMDIYGNGEEDYIVGYSPVLRSGQGNSAIRTRTIGLASWDKALSLEGNYQRLISTDNGSLINGDESLALLKLGISSGSINARTPLWAINENTNLSSFTATQGSLYFIYNASDNPITLTGTFRGFGSENLSSIEIPARQIIPIFAVTTNVYLLISSYFTNYETKIQNDKYNSNMVAITKNTNITDDIFPYIVANGQAVYNFIVAGSDVTLSLTTGVIYLNGVNSQLSCTLKARTSGTMMINKTNNTVYINSVQP